MTRRLFPLFAALVLAAPALQAQTTDAERMERDRMRQRAREERDRAREERDRIRRQFDQPASLDTVVAFDATGAVDVSCLQGDVVVSGSDRNEIRVKARSRTGGIRFTSENGRASLSSANGRGCEDGRFEVTVPAGARIQATTWSGSVNVRGVRGEIEARAQSGNVEVRDAGDRVDVEALSGDVTVENVKGDASIHTVSGSVQLTGARGDVEIESVSGDLDLRDLVTKDLRTHTVSGDVSFVGAILDAGRYDFGTHSGEIRLQLPQDVGAHLSISTFNGGIESDFPITLRTGEHGIGAAQAKQLNFTLGRGNARISAETFSGDVNLISSARKR